MSEPETAILYTDRSAAETDDYCGMKFYLNRHEAGRGITPVEEADALKEGRLVHELMSDIGEWSLDDESIERRLATYLDSLGLDDSTPQAELERVYRRLGWLAAWLSYIEPTIRTNYEPVSTESELILDRTPLWVAVTPDRVLRDRTDGRLVYFEYKSTISASSKWLQSWTYAIQLHIGLAALQEEFPAETVKFGYIVGLLKGSTSQADSRLLHPYVWAYKHEDGRWESEYSKTRSAGWSPEPVWNYPGGILAWVRKLGPEVARNQFPFTAPIFLNARMLDEWVERRTAREIEIQNNLTDCREPGKVRSIIFPKIQSRCRPAFGDACPYVPVCWNATTEQDPLKSGLFIKRTPHHDVEITLGGD